MNVDWPNPEPKQKHLVLDGSAVKEKIFIVGDVHGCLDELKELLIKSAYNPNDTTLILVGDLVNKGPYSAETVSYVRNLGAYCVRGNHDESALTCALKIEHKSARNYAYAAQFSSEDIEWLRELPYIISIPSYKIAVVHAGLVPNVALEQQSFADLVTMRNVAKAESPSHSPFGGSDCSGESHGSSSRWEGSSKGNIGEAWAKVWSEDPQSGNFSHYHVYFGHDAKRGLQQYEYATGLDTGCCYGRQLTGIFVPSKEIVQVDAHRVYEVPNID
eukprot:gene27177-30722_t